MFKQLFASGAFFAVISVCAYGEIGYKSPLPYRIISDIYDASIPDGYFRFSGKVMEGSANQGLPGAVVTEPTNTRQFQSNDSGVFMAEFLTTDSSVYCYLPGYSEVVIPGPFKNKHSYQVEFLLQISMEVAFKPVIYAYGSTSEFSLSLKPTGNFTFTYPRADNGHWDFKLDSLGNLCDLHTGKSYPYVFWEGLNPRPRELDLKTGFLISTDTCVQFLDNTLTAFGLNDRERTDFITFWAPKLMESPYAVIRFVRDGDYTRYVAQLDVNPVPESMLRLFMYYTPLSTMPEINDLKSPEILPFSRSGFTIVEWGGSVFHEFLTHS